MKTFGRVSHVLLTSNNWLRHLATFNYMVLPSTAVPRLPWRWGSTISLPRLTSNITVPSFFCYGNMFLRGLLVFWKIKFVKSKFHQSYLLIPSPVPTVTRCIMKGNNAFWLGFNNYMCLNVWKYVGEGVIENNSVLEFWLWGLICKFQLICVVLADVLCRVIYISIIIYQFLMVWMW